MIEFILKKYFVLYNFVAEKRIEAQDTEEWQIHAHLVIVLSTGLLMWGYAITAQLTVSHPAPMIVGYLASLTHLFSPLLFRINKNVFLNSNVLIASGLAHQSTFAYYTGGFNSNIIIWFGILPMIGGVICGKKGVFLWTSLTGIVTSIFLILYLTGYQTPNLISHSGFLLTQAFLSFGWIFLSAVIIWSYTILVDNNKKVLEEKNLYIQNLVHILSHDITNPLAVIKLRLELLLKNRNMSDDVKISLEKGLSGVRNISEIVDNVRQMYAMEHGKLQINMEKVCVFSLWNHLETVFEDKLKAKKLTLEYDGPDPNELLVWANESGLRHQVMSNLMSNAIKFSPEGSRISLVVKENKNGIVAISLRDQGFGIPEELMCKIFDIKAKTTREGTNGEVGTGFGMPIVKTFVDKIGGKIIIDSKTIDQGEDHGTSFTIEVRRAI